MIEFFAENINYHVSNIVILFVFSFIYTIIRLRVFRVHKYFFKEFIKNFFSTLFIYGIYMLFLFPEFKNCLIIFKRNIL